MNFLLSSYFPIIFGSVKLNPMEFNLVSFVGLYLPNKFIFLIFANLENGGIFLIYSLTSYFLYWKRVHGISNVQFHTSHHYLNDIRTSIHKKIVYFLIVLLLFPCNKSMFPETIKYFSKDNGIISRSRWYISIHGISYFHKNLHISTEVLTISTQSILISRDAGSYFLT